MKRTTLILLTCMSFVGLYAQTRLPQVRALEAQGWAIQHSVMSWDSLTVYFSAKSPGKTDFDLYRMEAEGWRWSKPTRLEELSTAQDEIWPSISSDEAMLFYVTRTHGEEEVSQVWRAWYREGQWREAAPLIISAGNDIQPCMMEDNSTLLFLRRESSKKREDAYRTYYSSMLDDHNWTIPAAYDTMPPVRAILALSGTIVMKTSGLPLPTGQVQVYDMMREQLLQIAHVHPMTGRWRVALQPNKHYRIAITAEGYSYHYIDIRTDNIFERREQSAGAIALDDKLALTIMTYDAETQAILDTQKEELALGKQYNMKLQHTGYHDTVLKVNTIRPMVFTHSELDIAMQPKKSVHHFVAVDARTHEPIDALVLRLNGQPTPADTALRLDQEELLQLSAPGYLFADTLFHTGLWEQEQTIRVALQAIEKNLVLQLRNIQFEYNSYQLAESSNEELEALAQLLFVNPSLRIELSSHTDDQGTDRYNDRLSMLRGQAVKAWLIERGIEASRLESVGYGKRKPLVPNDSEAHRAMNRRVEVKVLDY